MLEDSHIVDLYWKRSQDAISETSNKCSKYLYSIAYKILYNAEDSEEAVNDTYLGAWNSMPPHRPTILSTYLGKITRRVSINKLNKRKADKRGGGEIYMALDELSDCVPSKDNVEEVVERKELIHDINKFLAQIQKEDRDIFVLRYWFVMPIKDISIELNMSESKIKSVLFRTREKLNKYLKREGY